MWLKFKLDYYAKDQVLLKIQATIVNNLWSLGAHVKGQVSSTDRTDYTDCNKKNRQSEYCIF